MSNDAQWIKNSFKRLKEYLGVFEGAEPDRYHCFYISIQREIEILVVLGKYDKLLKIIQEEEVYTASVVELLIAHGKLEVLVDWLRKKYISPDIVFNCSKLGSRIKDVAIPFLNEFHNEIGQRILKGYFRHNVYRDDRLFALVVLQYLDSVEGLFEEELLQQQINELFANRDKYKF